MMRRLLRVTFVTLLALGASLVSWAPAQEAGASSIFTNPLVTTGGIGPIQHVIVIVQSGHSFDNYFGTRPGVDGVPPKTCLPIVVGSRVCVKSYHLNADQARAGLSSTLKSTGKAIDNGKMDGFVSAQPNPAIGTLAMGYENGADLPYYWDLASRFTLLDHFFASSQAGALPNRLEALAGTDGGLTTNAVSPGSISVPTVFDQLDQKHLSWKFYLQNYAGAGTTPTQGEMIRDPLLAMPPTTGQARTVGTSQYFADLGSGHLPAVSYVSGTSGDSEQSPQSPAVGEAFVSSIVNALMQSPEWYHTAVLLTYDDSGGWYDHLQPPVVGGRRLGVRVPAMLISPYARAGYVDHGQFQTASIPGFIDKVFGLPALNADATGTRNLVEALDLKQPAIAPAIDRGTVAVLVRPSVFGVYVLYLGALAAAGLLIALAFARMRRLPAQSSTGGAMAVPLAAAPTEGATGDASADGGTAGPGPGIEPGEPVERPLSDPVDVSATTDVTGTPPAGGRKAKRVRRPIFRPGRPAAGDAPA